MEKIVDEFIKHLGDEEGKSENTCLSYRRDLRQFTEWLSSHSGILNISEVAPETLEEYLSGLKAAGKSPATVSRATASIKAFFAYSVKNGYLGHDPSGELRAPKVFKKKPDTLSDKDMLRLLSQPDTESPKGIRDKAMLELLMNTGLRVSELIGIRCDDLNLLKKKVTIPGSRTRLVPFDRKVEKYITDYLENAREKLLSGGEDCGFLFLNVNGESMSRQGFWKVLKKYGESAGIEEEITPHMLRHSYAAHALRNGKDLKEVQLVMGHADISTTSGYLEL